MEEKHTTGKIYVRTRMGTGPGIEKGDYVFRIDAESEDHDTIAVAGVDQTDEEKNGANARRLVAAWNACLGIPTEELESKLLHFHEKKKE